MSLTPDRMKEANAYADSLNIQVPTSDKSPYPPGKGDSETYGSYRYRIDALRETGFDIARLSHSDYTDYCRGSYAPRSTGYDKLVEYYETDNTSADGHE